ncbi:unnamed protein product [Cyclocybe aegerita]|uniref:F-box domain-containing protein n=1 Tax=Cyclocybe aegerita TaxID=1973307 RepID=A0A8S0XH57_CYCAE|nr:unnamed protein product [Cyclocybe aegerita]
MGAGSFLALPAELQLEIMGILDAGSMLSLALSCRALHEQFKSPAIQYAYELLLSSMQDNGADVPLDILQLSLRRLRKGWESLDWTFGETVKLPGDLGRYALISGIFVKIDRKGADLSVCGLSSATQTGRTRTTASLDFHAIDFTIDPSQDLIVLLEKRELPDGRRRIQAHARCISADGAHPSAKVDSFQFDFVRHGSYSHKILLADDVVAIWSHHGDGRLLLWNWREGFLIYDSICSNLPKDIYSLEMLSREAFILMSVSGPGKFYVCKFSPMVPAPPTIVATLMLPPTASSGLLSFVTHSTQLPVRPVPGTPFMPVPDSRIHVFSLEYRTTSGQHQSYSLFVHSRAFLRPIYRDSNQTQAEEIPWDRWGPYDTRFTERRVQPGGPCASYGCRVLCESIGGLGIDVLDFSYANPYLTSRTRRHFGPHNPSVLPPNNVFLRQVVTRLPYHVTSRSVENHYPYYAIDEERVVGMKYSLRSGEMMLEVNYF